MKKQLLFILISVLSLKCYSQIKYESGYFINNEGVKTTCFIYNIDWKNNPTQFSYKLTEKAESKVANIKSVTEFGITGISKFQRYTVNIDRSSEDVSSLSISSNPDFNEEQLFLKVLVEGKATLYYYEDGNLKRFFFKADTSGVEQLVFKMYQLPEAAIGENNEFKQQLLNKLQCEKISLNDIEQTQYNKHDLVKCFTTFNENQNSSLVVFEKRRRKDLFSMSFRPGLNVSTCSVENTSSFQGSIDYGSKLSIRVGVEAEFLMPFNKNKWALIIEPSFQYFKTDNSQTLNIDYKSIELPVGIRHYFFINDNDKIFVNGSFIHGFSLNSSMNNGSGYALNIVARDNFAFGLGYKTRNKYSLEIKYALSKELFDRYVYWHTRYTTFSFIFGYKIF